MRSTNSVLIVLLSAALGLPGCGSSNEDVFDGAYEGEGVDSQASSNVKQFTLTVSSSGGTVSGSYTLKAVILDVSGSVSGTLNGSDVSLTLTPGATSSDCPYRVTGRWSGGRIAGNYAAFNCFVRSDGSVNLKKR